MTVADPANAQTCPARQERLRQELARAEYTALLVREPRNLRYLTGFTGSSGWLLITENSAWLGVDGRYTGQAREEAHGATVLSWRPPFLKRLSRLLEDLDVRHAGFEGRHLSHDEAEALQAAIPQVSWHSASHLLNGLRRVKDAWEIQALEAGAGINDRVLAHIARVLEPGRREREIALEMEYWSRRWGSEGEAFPTIVASGWRSALPHGVAGDRLLEEGDPVVLDFGARVRGYHSDFTRTLVAGEPHRHLRRLHGVVREAQRRALLSLGPGVKADTADRAARDYIRSQGLGGFFAHGLGHGVGLDIHEGPGLAPGQEQSLEPGMVVTVEPGVYIPGWAGVRIEDLVVITGEGCRVLSGSTRDLLCGPRVEGRVGDQR